MRTTGRSARVVLAAVCAATAIAYGVGVDAAVATPTPVPQDQVWAWGFNGGGLGDGGSSGLSTVPVAVNGLYGAGTLSGATAVSVGTNFSLSLLSNGRVAAWGENNQGQLGDGSTGPSSPLPALVAGLGSVAAIAAGGAHSLALSTDGSVSAWGANASGQLGNGSNTPSDTPVGVAAISGVSAIAAGDVHSLALAGGDVFAWGDNSDGELGDGGSNPSSDAPVDLGLTNVTAIAAGALDSFAVNSNGTVLAWGLNGGYGELGDGLSAATADAPVPVVGIGDSGHLSGVTAIAAGDGHTLALLSNGTVVAWGANFDGQLGDGTQDVLAHPAPVAVSGLTDVVAVAATYNGSYALQSNGTLWAWGGGQGALANGALTGESDVPVQVADLGTGVDAIAGGGTAVTSVLALAHPVASLSSPSLAFGTQAQDTIGPAQALTLTNDGAPGLLESYTTTSGANAGDFVVSHDGCAGQPLANGASCQIDLRFAPSATSGTAESATLSMATNAPGDPLTATLNGTAGPLPQGPAGPAGSTPAAGAAGPAGPRGAQGPAGQIELVTCKTVTVKVKHRRKTRQKCSTRLVTGTLTFTTVSVHASITRGHALFATGELTRAGHGRSELVLSALRPLRPGVYTLTTTTGNARHRRTTRTPITLR